jgi:SPP1 gp7 family putative phage head morphogenesis protein
MASKSSKYWDDRALRRLTGAEKTSEEYIKRVRKMYDKAYRDINKDIETIYKKYSKDTGIDIDTLKILLTKKDTDKVFKQLKAKGYDKYIKDNYKSRITRLEELKAQIYIKAKEVYTEEELINHQCYSEVYKDAYYKSIYDTQMGTGYNFGFNTLDDNLVKSVLNERWSGKNYKARVWANTDILAESVSEIVGASILSGQSLSKTSKEIRERFGVGKYYAERLIRTETSHFYNEADAMAYEEMGIDKYVFVAVLDNRTSPICQDHDNIVFNYKDKKTGFNFPPLHPNCRSTTRGYLGEEAEKLLQRRARDPKTGKNELIGNMSYKEWAKSKGIDVDNTKRGGQLPTKPKVKASKSVTVEPKKAKTWLKSENLPAWFKDYKGNVDTEGAYLTQWLNENGNPNSKASKVFSESIKDLGLAKGDTDKNTFISYNEKKAQFKRERYLNSIEAPRISDKQDPRGSIQIMLHENWHAIDYNKAGNGKYMSTMSDKLRAVVVNDDNIIGDDMAKMFNEYNSKCKDIHTRVSKDNQYLFTEINKKWDEGKYSSYSSYRSAWSKARSKISSLIEYEERNLMGGGMTNLQDIYDALSGGKFRDKGVVKYGHGSRYYRRGGIDSRLKEIIANYGAISMTRPDLVEMLRADKPNLVDELESLLDSML